MQLVCTAWKEEEEEALGSGGGAMPAGLAGGAGSAAQQQLEFQSLPDRHITTVKCTLGPLSTHVREQKGAL